VKAGQPGWYALIPYYNAYILTCESPGWNHVVHFAVHSFVNITPTSCDDGSCKRFGKSEGSARLFFLTHLFPLLAFGDASTKHGGSKRRFASKMMCDDYDDRPRKRRRDETTKTMITKTARGAP